MPRQAGKSQMCPLGLGRLFGVGSRLGGRSERLYVANQLPTLGFRELGPDWHPAPHDAIRQQPEEGTRGGLLYLGSAKVGALFAPLAPASVALGAMLFEEFGTGF